MEQPNLPTADELLNLSDVQLRKIREKFRRFANATYYRSQNYFANYAVDYINEELRNRRTARCVVA